MKTLHALPLAGVFLVCCSATDTGVGQLSQAGQPQGCTSDASCGPGFRCLQGTCTAFNPCFDGLLNGGESDIDCGGTCRACWTGQRCTNGEDCLSKSCTSEKCDPGTYMVVTRSNTETGACQGIVDQPPSASMPTHQTFCFSIETRAYGLRIVAPLIEIENLDYNNIGDPVFSMATPFGMGITRTTDGTVAIVADGSPNFHSSQTMIWWDVAAGGSSPWDLDQTHPLFEIPPMTKHDYFVTLEIPQLGNEFVGKTLEVRLFWAENRYVQQVNLPRYSSLFSPNWLFFYNPSLFSNPNGFVTFPGWWVYVDPSSFPGNEVPIRRVMTVVQ